MGSSLGADRIQPAPAGPYLAAGDVNGRFPLQAEPGWKAMEAFWPCWIIPAPPRRRAAHGGGSPCVVDYQAAAGMTGFGGGFCDGRDPALQFGRLTQLRRGEGVPFAAGYRIRGARDRRGHGRTGGHAAPPAGGTPFLHQGPREAPRPGAGQPGGHGRGPQAPLHPRGRPDARAGAPGRGRGRARVPSGPVPPSSGRRRVALAITPLAAPRAHAAAVPERPAPRPGPEACGGRIRSRRRAVSAAAAGRCSSGCTRRP